MAAPDCGLVVHSIQLNNLETAGPVSASSTLHRKALPPLRHLKISNLFRSDSFYMSSSDSGQLFFRAFNE